MNKRNLILGVLVCLVVAGLWQSWTAGPITKVSAAPAEAVITPVSNNNSNSGVRSQTFFSGAITADTHACYDLGAYDVMDLQYQIDQGTVNTVTLSIQYYNIPLGPSIPVYEDGATVVSANVADAHGFQQVGIFGRWTCVFADVANSNSLTLRVIGQLK